ncbi:NADH dehydrogenase subunit 4L (mitochondrion) [Carettochelys insculpta]|uniref:NADH-ubiquinone oxidoreductase chain 4L n=1 Tax=Carettochelys insculpta TaxID=44489 RepID=D5FW30_CARIN|nr:NADH dehydrogenase subunit 4L [Carettochelys insculpta]ACO83367.1 NADH dehydrogenase subunit 4L [Carettochelys insculpta]
MTPLHFISSSAFIISIMGLSFNRAHMISTLICLESMMLSLFIMTSMWLSQQQMSSFTIAPMLLLAFSACEAAMGLSLLVASSRTHGSNQLKNLNLLQC